MHTVVYMETESRKIHLRHLRLLVKKAGQTDTPVRVSYDPVDTERVNAVFFPNDKKAFIISCDENELFGDVRINMKRFVDIGGVRNIRSEYRLNSRLAKAFMDSALDSLAEAGNYHFELENIYAACMDFEEKEVFSNVETLAVPAATPARSISGSGASFCIFIATAATIASPAPTVGFTATFIVFA